MQTLSLFSTVGCHLCDDAKALIYPLLNEYSLVIKEVDIACSRDLVERYGVRIPVIQLKNSPNDLGWPFDEPALRNYLSSQS